MSKSKYVKKKKASPKKGKQPVKQRDKDIVKVIEEPSQEEIFNKESSLETEKIIEELEKINYTITPSKKSKKLLVISIACFSILMIAIITILLLFRKNAGTLTDKVELKLIGTDISLNLSEEYIEQGIKIYINDKEINNEYKIIGTVNNKIPNQYTITYKYNDYTIKRIVTVVDNINPIITLTNGNKMVVLLNEKYEEPGFIATDNIDGDLTDNVIVTGTVNITKTGTYKLTYRVVDQSGNVTEVYREVEVKEKLKEMPKPIETGDKEKPKPKFENNEVTKARFYNNGFILNGITDSTDYSIFLVNFDNKKNYDFSASIKNKSYTSYINLDNVPNGTYDIYFRSNEESTKVINKLDLDSQIVRANIKNKLVTIKYSNNVMQIIIGDFAYQYDVLINPGHGGNDPGAVNKYMQEKELNLIVSNYEKTRFEEHGLTVKMLRTSDNDYGITMGDKDWKPVTKSAYAIGYYGVVSKIAYSNHHNSSDNKKTMGWEIISAASLTPKELESELKIASELSNIYPVSENHIRFYTRNYDTHAIFSKKSGEVYDFRSYYAVNRIPIELFNVKNILFEGCYMSHTNDFNWYYTSGNWKKISEAKIKVYVESLGVKYIAK